MKKFFKNYIFLIIIIMISLSILIFLRQSGIKSFGFTVKYFTNFIIILTPVFICIGLLDVWVEKDIIIKIIGKKSGIRGICISILLGSVTAVPLYALLPVAGILLNKGGKISNILIFICSSSSIRIPLLLFEVSSMGWKFTVIRLFANIFVIIIIAFVIDLILVQEDKKEIL